MIFKDLINKYTFNDIKNRLVELYSDQTVNINGYEKVYSALLERKAVLNKMKIKINLIPKDKYSDNEWYDVYGVLNKESWSLAFKSFDFWLGGKIDQELLSKYSEIDIICHCLWEMTFNGFDDQSISTKWKKIVDISKKAKE